MLPGFSRFYELYEHLDFPSVLASCSCHAQDEKERELFAQIRKREDAEREVP